MNNTIQLEKGFPWSNKLSNMHISNQNYVKYGMKNKHG